MRNCLFILCLLLAFTAIAQNNLSRSATASAYTYIYRISNKEALKLQGKDIKKASEKFLHTKVDSFYTGGTAGQLPHGHYIFMKAQHNRLAYQHVMVPAVQVKVLNNRHDLAVLVHDSTGRPLSNAIVGIGNKRLSYDIVTATYRLNNSRKEGLLQVWYNDIIHLFSVEDYNSRRFNFRQLIRKPPLMYLANIFRKPNPYRYYDFFHNRTKYEQKHSGFLVFNKPIYKPGDTVRMKAYIATKRGKPVNRPLLLRLSDSYFDIDTILATVEPYRKGGYMYELVLDNSLALDLDDEYLFTLEEQRSRRYDVDSYDGDLDEDEYAMKRKVLVRGKIEYEEYELSQIGFAARGDKEVHHGKQQPLIYLKATDENGLPVLDGRVEIAATVDDYNRKTFGAPQVFLPDTLWQYAQPLETTGETAIALPNSIFPAASFNYNITCTFLNSNNERQTHTLHQRYNRRPETILFRMEKDSVYINKQVSGRDTAAQALVMALSSEGDTLLQQQLRLPIAVRLHPFAEQYKVSTATVADSFYVAQERGAVVYCTALRSADSIWIQLTNKHSLPVWYTLFAGNKAVLRGSGTTWEYKAKTSTRKNYAISLQYIIGGEVHNKDFTVAYHDKQLNVEIIQPTVIYPGQKADIKIKVTDGQARPVVGADVTAYAFTKKFTNARPPQVPYYGKLWGGRTSNYSPSIQDQTLLSHLQLLPWQRWSKELGLDSIEYFRFLHPEAVYTNWEPAPDSLTQIAPFVVKDGELLPVHHIYIDEQPYFFSQAEHLQRYSFAVSPGRHALRLRTANSTIQLDSIWATAGAKTFISINVDTANKRIRITPMPDTLTLQEQQLWNSYLIVIEDRYGEKPAYIEKSGRIYPLNLLRHGDGMVHDQVLVGPLSPSIANLVVKDNFSQDFEVEGGFHYRIDEGLVRQKWVGNKLYTTKLSKAPQSLRFSAYVFTKKTLDSLWQQYLDNRSATQDLFHNITWTGQRSGRLLIDVKDSSGKTPFIKAIILFRSSEPDFISIHKGQERNINHLLPGGDYRLMLLLHNNEYYLKNDIAIKPAGINYYELIVLQPNSKDSISTRIAAIINKQQLGKKGFADKDVINKLFNSRYLDASGFLNNIEGRVIDRNGNPMAFATVTIKGTTISTVTDVDGYYSLLGPTGATIIVAYAGFAPVEERPANDLLTTTLYKADHSLQEVVVVGYGTARKKSVTGSIAFIQQGEQYLTGTLSGKVAGIQIRGLNSTAKYSLPLIIVDGIPFSGKLDDLDQSGIASMNVLHSEEATKLYGAIAASGAVIIATKKVVQNDGLQQEAAMQYSLRRAFRDHAWWQPALMTDADGHAKFTTTFPDDVTAWRSFAIAMADGRRSGFAEGNSSAFKTVTAMLHLPQFLVWGDSATVIGKTQNYLQDSLQAQRRFLIEDSLVNQQSIGLKTAWIDSFAVVASHKDSLKLQYTIQKSDGYFDGEERKLPLVRRGTVETTGLFAALNDDTSFIVPFDVTKGEVTIHAESSVLDVLLDEIDQVRRYEYYCNEQAASKLKALLQQQNIYRYLKRPFKDSYEVEGLIKRLEKTRLLSGLWSWWSYGEPQLWISLHVVEALLMAESAGFKVSWNKQGLIDYLMFHIEETKGLSKLECVSLLYALGAKADYKQLTDSLLQDTLLSSDYAKLRLMELRQRTGQAIVVDTLLKTANHTAMGNVYFGENGYHLFNNATQQTLMAYRMLRTAGGHERSLQKMRAYFLESRSRGSWRNTYESALILETILPDMLQADSLLQGATLTVGKQRITDFPFTTKWNEKELLTISKSGGMPVYFTAYQQVWNPNPQAVASNFVVSSSFRKEGKPVEMLTAGKPVDLQISVEVKGDAEYVLIEVPIPAGCSFNGKPQPKKMAKCTGNILSTK